MVFACQNDSFQTTFTSKVVSCTPGKMKSQVSGKTVEKDCFEIICEDTILFPEGGGQPYDTGFLNDVRVEQVQRRGAEAVHFVDHPIDVGVEVNQVIDWERRLDHMQQHSGQHLITALASAMYNYETTSWWLGENISHIELETTKMTQEEMINIEKEVNKRILEQIPVKVNVIEDLKSAGDVRARGLPKDHQGQVRIIEIVGIEENMCCGTHVTNLGQLQCVKLLYFEKGKKNKTNLMFLVGGRVLKFLSNSLSRENQLTGILKNGPEQHVDLVQKMQTNLKVTNKKLSNVLKELAVYEVEKFKKLELKPKYLFNYYKDGDVDFLSVLLKELKDVEKVDETLFVWTVGEERGAGNLVIFGKEDLVKDLGPRIAEELNGKGLQHGTRFQAKVNSLQNIKNVHKLLKEHF